MRVLYEGGRDAVLDIVVVRAGRGSGGGRARTRAAFLAALRLDAGRLWATLFFIIPRLQPPVGGPGLLLGAHPRAARRQRVGPASRAAAGDLHGGDGGGRGL